MTTQSHPRPSFVNGSAIFFVVVAIVVSAAIAAVRIDWRSSSPERPNDSTALAPSVPGNAPSAQELFESEMAATEAQWDAIFGPLQLNVTPSDDISRMKAEHDNAITGTLGVTESFGSSIGPAPLTDEEQMAVAVAEHEAGIAPYVGQ